MRTLKKYHYLAFPIFYAFFLGLMMLFSIENTFVKLGVPPFFAVLLSPRYTTIDTQVGEKTIVKWLFFKKRFIE